MLIRFSVENFLSFRDEVELSMIPGKGRKHPEHVVSNGKRSSLNVLRAAVIYGPNASGKSNLIQAMHFAKTIITGSRRPRQTIPVIPFKFDSECDHKPSKFQFEFKHRSKAYIYGFTLDTQQIHTEWLYEITPTSEKPLFERTTGADGETSVEFSNIKFSGSRNREFLEFTATGTRPNQLFLTESIERNIPYFEDVFNWFKKVLVVIFPESRAIGLEGKFVTNKDFQRSFTDFLQLLDTGIADVHLIPLNLDDEPDIPKDFMQRIKDAFLEDDDTVIGGIVKGSQRQDYLVLRNEQNEFQVLKFMTVHPVKGEDRTALLDVSEESDGTQRLFHLIPALIELLTGERVFVIDELDRSLHPHLSRKIIELFLSLKPEQKSQMIVTTHESSLLDLDLLRRDEIWFVEKNPEGASAVYSLEEFAPRYDRDIRKGYLLGRFGAIPFIKDTGNFGWLN